MWALLCVGAWVCGCATLAHSDRWRGLRRPTARSPTTPAAGASPKRESIASNAPASAKRPRVGAAGTSAPAPASASSSAKKTAPAYEEDQAEGPRAEPWLHQQASWLQDIRDANKRRPGDPGYDPTTLYYP
eukprot:COSAG02_NODE_21537_length_784_cov_1.115328_1_plen_130_part_01